VLPVNLQHSVNFSIAALLITAVSALAAPPTIAWPGGSPARIVDERSTLGGNVSGLAMAGTSRLLAVRDGPGALLQLDRSGSGWTASPDWGNGRPLLYADGSGSPDAEAVAVVTGAGAGVYVGAERDSDKANTSRNSILRYDTTGLGPLQAVQQWELNSVLPTSSANAGIEGLAWIPDDVFVSMGLRDEMGTPYVPADHPNHGDGLFVVGLEQTGSIHLVALRDNGSAALIASMASGLPAVMEVAWHAERRELWALCDNTCDGRAAVWTPAPGGFVLGAIVAPPASMSSLNNEGFAISPRCVEGTMLAVWSDDGATDSHVLREASIPCAAIAATSGEPSATLPAATRQPTAAVSGETTRSSRTALAFSVVAVTVVALVAAAALHRRRRTPGRRNSEQ
jgi:hypothetical protein